MTAIARSASPLPNAVVGMGIFLTTEIMFFAGLLSAYLILRGSSPTWPPPFQPRLPIGVTALNTLVLLASGFVMARATTRFLRGGSRSALILSLSVAAGLGALFLSIQGYEWVQLVSVGLTVRSSRFASMFYTIVGAHGLHVLVAFVALALVTRSLLRPSSREREAARLRAMRMYWTFVVAMWPVLYVLLYLA